MIASQSCRDRRFRVNVANRERFALMENKVYDWILDHGFCVTGGMIKFQALSEVGSINPSFSASCGWLKKFLKRKRLVMRRITTSGRDLPKDCAEIVNSFLKECEHDYMQHDFDRDGLVNSDETSIYLDPPTTRTYSEIGSRRVEARTTGNQKTRISILISASASGKKLNLLVLIPRKNPLKNFVVPANVTLLYGTKGCFNDTLISEHYISRVLAKVQERATVEWHQINFRLSAVPYNKKGKRKI